MGFADRRPLPLADEGPGDSAPPVDLIHRVLGTLADGATASAGTALGCGHGERAMTALGLLARQGSRHLAVPVGSGDDRTETTGRHQEDGS